MIRPARRLAFFFLSAFFAGLLAGCGGGSDSPSGPGNGEEKVRVMSVEPADGTYGLSDSVVVRVEFDEPVLEVGAILVPSLRGLAGNGSYLQWLIRSEDMRTFSRTVALEPNTAYQLLVVWALGADSTGLEEPRVVGFSTTAEAPNGTIEGHIDTPPSYDPDGSILILVDAYHWIGWAGQDFQDYILALGWVDDPGGDYRIGHLAPGKYYLYAFRNVTENGSYSEEKSLFGIYTDGLYGPIKAIDVRNDAVADSIDFPMYQGQDFFGD
jgi:hypothetical protein